MSEIPELAFLDATAQADLVRRKEITPLELTEAAIARIERLNPMINAVVTQLFDEARQTAKGLIPEGPFAGVPFLLKDILASYAGVPMSLGARLLKDFKPDHDSELVTRYKQAGLIILGKTNVPEFGLMPTTEPELFGPCRNPWDLTRTAGGSSGGSAAAVAAGLVPMAHGNDGGGSIRIPASCCGLFGLKPTRGRNPLGPDFGDLLSGLIVEHALTRTVRDSAALLDATCGPDLGDPYWAPPKARPYIHEVGDNPGSLRIAYTTDSWSNSEVNPECRKAVLATAEQLTELGHRVEKISPPLDKESLARWFTVIWAAGCASTIEAITAGQAKPDMFEPLSWALYEMSRKFKMTDYLAAISGLQRVGRTMARFHLKYDMLLTPTLGEPPVPLGMFDASPDYPLAGWHRSGGFAPFTPLANATGQPSMSVPLYWTEDDLPVGVQFIGRFGEEALLFRLAAQLEEAFPWAHRHPTFKARQDV